MDIYVYSKSTDLRHDNVFNVDWIKQNDNYLSVSYKGRIRSFDLKEFYVIIIV